jgi:hypothetical protein
MIALDTLLRARLPALSTPAPLLTPGGYPPAPLVTGWSELDAALPDGGFPRGVIELSAPRGLGGATSIALAAVRAAHLKDARAYCAWVDCEETLFAPGVAKAGVDLDRLLVVRPPPKDVGRIAAKVADAKACEVVVVDLPQASLRAAASGRGRGKALRPEVLVRKLALAAEQGGASVFLLTDSLAPKEVSWPVALRLEVAHAPSERFVVKVAKDRRGRVGQTQAVVPMKTRPGLSSAVVEAEESGVSLLREGRHVRGLLLRRGQIR